MYILKSCVDLQSLEGVGPAYCGLDCKKQNSWSEITTNLLEIMASCQSNIFYPLPQQFKSKKRSLYLQNWRIYGLLYLKTKMGMASLIFDPHPPNFANLHNFLRCTNDIIMTFWNSFWFQIYKKPQRVIRPGNSVVHEQTWRWK